MRLWKNSRVLCNYYNKGANPFTPEQIMDLNLLGGDFAAALPLAQKAIFESNQHSVIQRLDTWGRLNLASAELGSTEALASAACVPEQRNHFWVSGTGDWAKLDSVDNAAGFDADIYGLSLGYDFASTRNFLAGVALGYSDATTRSKDNHATKVDSTSYFAGLYAAANIRNFVIEANAFYGDSKNKAANYYNAYSAASFSKYHTEHWGGDVEIGYDWAPNCFTVIRPFAGLEYYHGKQKAFDETYVGAVTNFQGSLARRFAAHNYNSLEIPVGVKLSQTFRPSENVAVGTNLSLAYAREVADAAGGIEAQLINSEPWWRLRGISPGRDAFRAGFGVQAQFCKRVEVGLDYNFEIRKNYMDNRLKASVGLVF